MAKTSKEFKKIPVDRDTLSVRPDTVDFRDRMYVPTLVEVPTRIPLEQYKAHYPGKKAPVLDQGKEGACTGFGLAAVSNFLLSTRKVVPDPTPVSPRMFYEMARRYDEWPGERYSGSSARGAMKGWHKHGVCSEKEWTYEAKDAGGTLTHVRAVDAARRPLGAYFRVNQQDLVAMHSALAEVGILYATSTVHQGWDEVGADGIIPFTSTELGGHAFAMVGYDERGFWIQNSWDTDWGKGGFALITYDDWLANGTDVWVARLGAPVQALEKGDKKSFAALTSRSEYSFSDLRSHVISIGNEGLLKETGQFANGVEEVEAIFRQDLPRLMSGWRKKRLLLYAHGGLVGEDSAMQRVEEYRKSLLDAEVYPLAFIWHTDFWSTLGNILKEAMGRRRPEGFWDKSMDFMLDRLDDTLEPLSRPAGKAAWSEMKENALGASQEHERRDGGKVKGGALVVLECVMRWLAANPGAEVHVAGHSAGSILMAPLVKQLTDRGVPVTSLTLWAPACTMQVFHDYYFPVIRNRKVGRFSLFTLKDAAERDDSCAGIYHKSLLYLVSNAFEEKHGLLWKDGAPLLGMEKFIFGDRTFKAAEKEIRRDNPHVVALFGMPTAQWIRCPNSLPIGGEDASNARHHAQFDDDRATVEATLARLLGRKTSPAKIEFTRSMASLDDRRRKLEKIIPV